MGFRLLEGPAAKQGDDATRYGEALLKAEEQGKVGTAAQLGITETEFDYDSEPTPAPQSGESQFRLIPAEASPASPPPTSVPSPRFRFDDQLPDVKEGPSLVDSMKRSYYDFRKGIAGVQAMNQMQALENLTSGDLRFPDHVRKRLIEQYSGMQQDSIKNWVEYTLKAREIPQDEQVKRLTEATTVNDAIEIISEAPIDVIAQLTASNAFQFVPQMAATIAGSALGGVPGLMFGAGLASGGIDYMSELQGALAEAGVDTTDPAAIYQALNNPELISKVKESAYLHAEMVAVLDGMTAGLAGKILAPAKFAERPFLREATNIGAQTVAQMGGGAGGEYLGSEAKGDSATVGSLFAEALAEAGGGLSDVASAVITGAREPSALGGDTDSSTGRPTKPGPPKPPGPEELLVGQSEPFTPITEEDKQLIRLDQLEQKLLETAEKYGAQPIPTSIFGGGTDEFTVPLGPMGRRTTMHNPNISDQQLSDLLDAVPELQSKQPIGLAGFQAGEQTQTLGFDSFNAGDVTKPNLQALRLVDDVRSMMTTDALAAFAKKYNLQPKTPEFRRMLRKELLRRIPIAEKQLARITHEAVSSWVKNFFPQGTKVLVGDGTIVNYLNEENDNRMGEYPGWAARLQDNLLVVEFNTRMMIPAMLTDIVGTKQANSVRNLLFGVMAHEFGHTIIGQTFHEMPEEVQQAVIGEYEQMLQQFAQPGFPAKPFINRWFRPQVAESLIVGVNEFEADNNEKLEVSDIVRRWRDGANYILNFDEWTAEQIARVMQGRSDYRDMAGLFWRRVVSRLKRFYTKVVKRFSPNETMEDFVDYVLTRKRLSELQAEREEFRKKYKQNIDVSDRIADTVKKVMSGERPPPSGPTAQRVDPEELRGNLDTYNKGVKHMLTLTQLVKLNKHIPALQQYIDNVRRWWNTKLIWTAKADARLRHWRAMTHQQSKNFANFLSEVTLESDKLERGLTPAELEKFATKWKLTEDMFTLFDEISQDMNDVVDALERVSERDLANLHKNDPEAYMQALAAMKEEMDKLRNRNYFPLARFGEFTATVRAKRAFRWQGKSYSIGDIVSFEQREFKSERDALVRQLKKSYPKDSVDVLVGKLRREDFAYQGMPPQLIARVKEILGDKPQQLQDFEELLYKLSPAQSFKKHLLSRKGTPGFDKNAMRAYADYFARFSNHIARIEYHGILQEAINGVYESATTLHQSGVDSTKRTQIGDYLDEHFKYIMNPQNEWANLRALGFMWYLGFLVKSAVVNLTQVPLVTYPWLAHRHGDKATVAELTKAYKTAFLSIRNSGSLSPELQEAVSQGIADGFLDESLATELAAIAEGSVLQRYTGGTPLGWDWAQRAITTTNAASAYLFQQAEKVNRRVAFIAAFQLAKRQGKSNATAYEHARDAVESTQYEYARWNRAKFMRGRRSIIFLFWQYLQNTMFFAFGGDRGAARFWAMMLLAGGLQGLPGSDDLMKMLTFFLRKMGWTEKDVQQDLREMVKQIHLNPDLVMHGLSRYSFGLPQVFSGTNFTWAPNWMQDDEEAFRGFDLSGSLSMGRVIPGLPDAMVASTQGKDARDMWYEVQADVGGAFVALPMNLMLALSDDHPDWYKRWERMMPTAVKSIGRAFKYATEGQAESRTGGAVEEFDINDYGDRALIIGQALGFRPGDLAREQEKSWAARSTAAYWEARRRMIMQNYWWAWKHNDSDALQAVYDEWSKYNKQAPYRELKISHDDLARSLKARRSGLIREEKGIARSNRNRGIQEEVYQLYPE